MRESRSGKHKKRWGNLTYTTRVTAAFALVSAMTALVAFGVLSFVWEQHFQTYTRENMQRIASTTASAIGSKYEQSNDWYNGALTPASSASELSNGVGVQVLDSTGAILYDDSRTTDSAEQISLAPTSKDSMAQATIYANGQDVGTVRVWVYGSSTLLTQADQEFRNKSYQAMVFSTALAVVLALFLGFVFARGLVQPIRRIAKAAKSFGDGNLSARTELHGDDEIAKLGETFDAMAESVEKDRQLERRLTTDVAHELRTPLMAIQSTVEAMVDGVFAADQERLETVNSEVQRLSRLVDAILKLSRLENRSVSTNMQIVNVGELIQSIVSTHEAFVADSGLELRYSADPDVYVYGDPDLIRQATANFISNAVRYTPEGHITVTVSKGDENAAIAVADTGIGLSPEEAKMVFSRFWRADAGRNRAQGGLGVGLSLVKEIADIHEGWVRVEGEKGVGSTFTMYIPLFSEERVKSYKQRMKRSFEAHNEEAESGEEPR
ncbi:cell wall metabolism sensor histidine kinase WalK [Denitrobacterium detoxificans]|uniref:sensor histidine kinase n=1 Tax=Denitrobacterium detoxificans TaxID=79604 RepID=UPI0026EBEC97|nr:HAMP domain-containing sensor histidine kinase [Denitrobacterium detoxificans]MBE6466316.1 HAMP domain-containing histidine kinase [Denitrobacterium detoxificans]